MNSLVKVFSNFKEFYSEINGATLTGAIDVIVVEQPDGEFQCSPFHVRFGKLGVLRSREKVVDIEINGEPVDIHMKLGDSGEAFFVEECPEDDVEELPDNLATSPLPTSYFPNKYDDDEKEEIIDVDDEKIKNHGHDERLPVSLVLPRRNSIDFSKETIRCEDESNFENQVSDYSQRRHTDNTLERRNLNEKLKEYTTQKIRQKWAEQEEIFQFDAGDQDKDWQESTNIEEEEKPLQDDVDIIVSNDYSLSHTLTANMDCQEEETIVENKDEMRTPVLEMNSGAAAAAAAAAFVKMENAIESASNAMMKEESKSKKKRRKKSQMKKKNAQRKSSSSSSVGSNATAEMSASNIIINAAAGGGNVGVVAAAAAAAGDDCDTISMTNNNRNSSNDELMPMMTMAVGVDGDGGGSVDDLLTSSTLLVNVDAAATASATATATATATTMVSEINNHSIEMSSPSTTRIPDLDIHFFSDTEVTSSGGNGSCGLGLGLGRGTVRPSTPVQSDSELEISLRGKDADVDLLTTSASWKWGELPTPDHTIDQETSPGGQMAAAQAQRNSMLSGMFNFMKKTNKMRKQQATEGLYLSELDASSMDPEMAALYFPPANVSALTKGKAHTTQQTANDDDRESGNGTSLPHSPSSMECQKSIDSDYEDGVGGSGSGGKSSDAKYLDFVAMSLCGLTEKGEPSDEQFDRHIIKYSDVCENPTLFASPNLVVRLNGKYYSWAAACPIVMTIITFQKPLTNDAVEQIISDAKQDAAAAVAAAGKNEMDGNLSIESVDRSQAKRSWWYWRRPQGGNATDANANVKITKDINKLDNNNKLTEIDGSDQAAAVATQTTRPNSPDASDNTLSKTDSMLNAENNTSAAMVENLADLSASSVNSQKSQKNERYKKTLRLSSEAIKMLNLKDGTNEIEFSVTTAYQGTTRCKCCLFRWKYSDKVVISDIDGTITKSDVLGHLLPMVGKDWAQLGVAQLFSKIEQNGYKLLYLSARAIGQSRATREYLRSIRQGDVKLPDGPLLLNPTSLISAFHREVIERKPEQFKIACLSDIRDLFPDKQPFYAGYGNRINDVWAYRAVGIPIMRIFTINTKGELKHELTQTFQSSYCSMTYIVDQLFPPINVDEGSIEFSSFNYWRDPILELNLDPDGVELPIITTTTTTTETTTTATTAATTTATTIIIPTAMVVTTTATTTTSGDDIELKTVETSSSSPAKFPVIANEKN